MPPRRAVEAGHASQSRIAAAFNRRTAALIRRAWREGAERDVDVAVWLNTEGHRSFRGLAFTDQNVFRIRRATRCGYAPRRFRTRSDAAPPATAASATL